MAEYNDRIPGALSQINIEPKIREILLDYMANAYPKSYSDFIWSMLGDDKFLMFFDVLENLQIKIPSRQVMARTVCNINMYSYIKERGATEEAFAKAAHIFKKRESALHKTYEQIQAVLDGNYTPEEEEECTEQLDE